MKTMFFHTQRTFRMHAFHSGVMAALCLLLMTLSSGCGEESTTDKPSSVSEGSGALKSPSGNDPRFEIARRLLRSGDFNGTEVLLEAILAEHPDNARAMFLLGVSIQKQKRYEAALARFDSAIKMNQSFPEEAHEDHFRGWCLYHLGRLDEAKSAFNAHAELFPDEGDTQFGLGIIALDQGDLELATTHLERAIELQSSLDGRKREVAKAHARLGDVHLGLDRLDDARESYHTAVKRWPDHYEAWSKLARVLDRVGEPEMAERARAEEVKARQRTGRPVEGMDLPLEPSS